MVTASYTIDISQGHQALGSTSNELTVGTSGHGVAVSTIETIKLYEHGKKKALHFAPMDAKASVAKGMMLEVVPDLERELVIMYDKPKPKTSGDDENYQYIGLEFSLGRFRVRCISGTSLIKYAIKKDKSWIYCRSAAMIKRKASGN